MTSWIQAEDTLYLWMVIMAVTALAITIEQKWKWGARVSSCVMCIAGGMILANLKVIPFSSPVYDSIGNILLLLAIPLLLFKSDIRKIYKSSGTTFLIFNICAVSAFLASCLIPIIFRNVDNIAKFAAMYSAAAVGGTVNAVAITQIFDVPTDMLNGLGLVGNFTVAMIVFFFGQFCRTKFFRTNFRHPHIDEYERELAEGGNKEGATEAAMYWKSKGISLKDIAQAMAITFVIVSISQLISGIISNSNAGFVVKQLFGSVYLVMTLLTTIVATAFPKFMGNVKGSDELGNIMLLMWFVTIGCSANLVQIIQYGGLIICAFYIVFAVMCLLVFAIGKIFKFDLEEMMVGIIASIGGPPTAAALSISMGWKKMVVPGVLVGLYGYIIGNYVGVLVGNIFGA
ncbi:DUF819 family protein [Anaerotignum lactatifermentans]|uniref:DUF819 family protein n=1 Tax=Anaerotignum lactatifermentans TaxID=160404 RepID=A0ABS2GA12_9FIRM|nr:DUF819 family protein [Anaerotignum lactatifermentans]MBM6829190.1 DUF819 family protein [Anaerotignum lactatifermentans]MBM6877570.1 DUF819 family protein [Anaerotignum lactatifermentans]MBM6950768.1 DUF819 family protein [Anaerotignum lactatifermentans]